MKTKGIRLTKDVLDAALAGGTILGGGGGGKPDFAMAGIRDTSKIDDALNAVEGIVKENLEKAN